ncbi:hypothetical protein PanWU01x14_172150 [Parasponia andersonii]|uniref:Uncharacterized protein n=1 Tax=Parasponia andersonii TaxID=3476 RepID=A0A2P5C9E8_PARAD|nr:hypothetical protein PanWU01x14_172150 [Parasponia andersonii]
MSFSRSGSISKKGKGKSCEETVGVEENSSDSMHKKVENLIFNYDDKTSPRRGKLKKSPSSKISHQNSYKPSPGNAKQKLVDDLGGGEALTKKGQCIAVKGDIPDENISASPDVQNHRSG